MSIEEITNEDCHAVAKLKIATHSRTTKIEITIFHTDIVTTISVIFYFKRRSETSAKHIKLLRQNLDITSIHLWILALALTNGSYYLNAEFTTKFVGLFAQRCIFCLVENKLGNTIAVTKINEGHTSHLSNTLYPSGKCYFLASIRESQLSTSIASVHILYML
ncbi:uncharacterized protein BN465_02253 [Prevotella sp. CAG:1092]|nr:uncharacterized protein BN465_02253 [Prevotella sp. CAG:1092]